MMRPRSFNYPVQGTASDLARNALRIEFLMWDVDYGRVLDADGVVHCFVVVMGSDLDGSNERVMNANVNMCAVGETVGPSTTITCIACLARGPAHPRKNV
jgi:hypothetical protein